MLDFDLQWNMSHFKGQADPKIEAIIRDELEDVASHATRFLRERVPYHRGNLYESIHEGHVDKHNWGWSITVGMDPAPHYAEVVHEGRGNLGTLTNWHNIRVIRLEDKEIPAFTKAFPSKREIAEGVVFTRRIKAQPPNPYLDDTHREVDNYLRIKKREIARRISRALSD